ncbi:MAG: amidohydrolase family protein, partial [Firmicutes bacterium]|nr:amidohydrolase family protein [Bacillota bacterium]
MLPTQIIDFHVHFPAKQNMPRRKMHPLVQAYAKKLRDRWRQEYGFSEPETKNPGNDVQAERWASEVKNNGLRKIVLMTGGGNETLAHYITLYPDQFCGFAHHDLCEPDALTKLKYALDELHLVGYKWFGPRTTIPFESPALKPFWTLLAERRAPVLIHFGVLGGPGGTVHHPRINPLTLTEVAQAYPDIPFIIPHFGAGYFQELLHLAWSSPNIYIDTSGSNDWIKWCPYPLTLQDLFAKSLDTVGP